MRVALPLVLLLAGGCMGDIVGYDEDPEGPDARPSIEPRTPDAGMPPDGMVPTGGGDGVVEVSRFPFHGSRDSRLEPRGSFDFYSCDDTIDESGPEVLYHVTVPAAGFLSAAVYEDPGVDVDVHIL